MKINLQIYVCIENLSYFITFVQCFIHHFMENEFNFNVNKKKLQKNQSFHYSYNNLYDNKIIFL